MTFFHGLIFRVFMSFAGYGAAAFYSDDFDTIVGAGTVLFPVLFMVIWAVQVNHANRTIPVDLVKKGAEVEEWDEDLSRSFEEMEEEFFKERSGYYDTTI